MSEALSGRFDGWLSFQDRLAAGMAMAAADPADLYFCDLDFAHWPLGSASVVEAFHQWVMASSATQCLLLALHFDAMPRQHSRWIKWRQPWGHRVQCRVVPEDAAAGLLPTFVLKDRLAIRIMDVKTGAGIWSTDPATIRDWLSEIDVISQRSHEALPVTTLGL